MTDHVSACVPSIAIMSGHTTSYPLMHASMHCRVKHHQTEDGRAFRTLKILDEHSRECLAIRVKRKLNSTEVIDALTDLFILRGVPAYIRSPLMHVNMHCRTVDNVLYSERSADLASGHCRVGRSQHVRSMSQFGFLVNEQSLP